MPGCVWLDSSLRSDQLGRYSYLAADPFCTLRIEKTDAQATQRLATQRLDELISRFRTPRLPGLPPLQGGWMGWFGYELGGSFEKIPAAQFNEFHLPLAALGLYDVVLSWDHTTGDGWVVSQGWPVIEPLARQQHAYRRLQRFLSVLEDLIYQSLF